MVNYKQYKKFLDLLAIGAGLKKFNPKKHVHAGVLEMKLAKMQKAHSLVPNDNTFLTSVKAPAAQLKLKRQHTVATDLDDMHDKDHYSDIDLNMDYSDDEDHNYFENDKAVLNHLLSIEESNLFIIKNLEENELTLEKMKEQTGRKVAAQEAKIADVDRNIRELEENCRRLIDRKKYFEQKTGKRVGDINQTSKVKLQNK